MDSREQWKLNGDCSCCRRLKYCGNICTAAQRRRERQFKKRVAQSMLKVMVGAYQVYDTDKR